MDARSLELFFIDGLPDGMLTAEVFNWTGHVLRFPRTKFREALRRPETQHTGVYVLIGERDGTPLAYIGEAENVADRLRGHIANKDWWDSAVCISTTGDLLHKAHVKYLESRLVEIARQIGSMPLENGNTPPRSSLSEAAQANMESFLETLGIVLPAIRVDMFLNKARSVPKTPDVVASPTDSTDEKFILRTPRHDLYAEAVLRDGEWVVQAGARARDQWVGVPNAAQNYRKLYEELVENGTMVNQDNFAVFQKDFAFSSPSAAGAVITGRSINGRTAWKHAATGQTYEDWEKAQIAAEVTP